MKRTTLWAVIFLAVLSAISIPVYRAVMHNPVDDILRESSDNTDKANSAPSTSPRTVKPARQPRVLTAKFVGASACRECHADTCDLYQTHPMSRSTARTTEASPLEDYTQNTEFGLPRAANYQCEFRYSVENTGTAVLHHEKVLDRDGNELGRVTLEADYAVGSGKRGRSYLIDHDGIMFMSPITWYSSRNRWDLSPAYAKFNMHFERRIISGCVACHVGRVAPLPQDPDRFQQPPFLEHAIGCERCHGPGEEHIRYHQTASEKDADPIVNPASLSQQRMNALCFQCHLHGAGRVAHHGLTDYDFHAADRISDVWTLLITELDLEDKRTTEAATQGEQMMVSRCFQATNGQFGCTSCHDPHRSPSESERVAWFRSRCTQCHSDNNAPCAVTESQRRQSSPEDSCIQCHMPRLPARDVPHTSLTDHRILRNPNAAPKLNTEKKKKKLIVFDNEDSAISDAEVKRAKAILALGSAWETENRTLAAMHLPALKSWVDDHPDDVKAVTGLGAAYYLTYDLRMARKVWESGLTYHPDAEDILRNLAILCDETEDFEAGVRYSQRLLQINPWIAEDHGRLAHMLGRIGRLKEAIPIAERAVQLSPWEAYLHGWLSESYRAIGNHEKSAYHRRLFEVLSPVSE